MKPRYPMTKADFLALPVPPRRASVRRSIAAGKIEVVTAYGRFLVRGDIAEISKLLERAKAGNGTIRLVGDGGDPVHIDGPSVLEVRHCLEQ